MKSIGQELQDALQQIGKNDDQTRINRRATQVKHAYKRALETVYGQSASIMLDHTNNVYITTVDDRRKLIVYVDESIFAADLNAQRELIKMKLLEQSKEQLDDFEIYISKGPYKNNHPYKEENLAETLQEYTEKCPIIPLTPTEEAELDAKVSVVSNEILRESIKKAMKANLEWKKGQKALGIQKS